MIRNNKYVKEKFFNAGKSKDKYIEVFINPTADELKEIGDNVRAFIVSDNFYVVKNSVYLFHYQVWYFIASKLNLNDDYFEVIRTQDDVISFQRDSGNNFYLSESYEDDKEANNNLKHNIDYGDIISKVKIKNPYVNFINKIIGEYR